MAAELLRWVFPTNSTDPVLHLAYWHVRLLSDLVSPPTRAARQPNMLHATGNVVSLLASNHDLLSPLTHHFLVLASLALLELSSVEDAEEVREEAARLVKLVLEFSLSPSPWNVAVRERLGEVVVSTRLGTGTGTGQGTTASRNLQQLADLATAVENSVATAAAAADGGGQVEDGLKDESLVSVAAAVAAAGGSGVTKADGDRDGIAQPAVDVRALLRAGYLTCFEDPAKDGLPL
jgi:hypothetical protein